MFRRFLSCVLLALTVSAFGENGYLFSYFSNNGAYGRRGEAAGLHLAWSFDGLTWTAFNDDQPILIPAVGVHRLMRDPSLCRGPDGTFHLVWTCDWQGTAIGYASSKDLVHWSEQRLLNVMADIPETRNCWAPEITYNPDDGLFYLYWSSTVTGRHTPIPDMDQKEFGLNHRIYRTTTKDFQTFTPTRLWFNSDYSAIDAAVIRIPRRSDVPVASERRSDVPVASEQANWLFFVKNENHTPVQKDIRLVRTATLDGEISPATGEALTHHWTEGPAALFVGKTLYLYYDAYRNYAYGALRSDDYGETWKNVSNELHVPFGMRHGTALAVDRRFVYGLLRTHWPRPDQPAASVTNELPNVSLAGLTMGAEKLLKYGEKVRVEGELTYLVSEGSDFRLIMDPNGELKVVAVPGWWTTGRVVTALVIAFLLFGGALGWAFFLRHQRAAEARMNDAVQKERLRLSHDLHDGYQQLLAGCMFRLTAAQTLLGKGNIPKAAMQLEGLQGSLTRAQDELRAALWTMKEEAEGPAAMAELFRYAASRLPQWEGKVTFESEGEEKPLNRRYAGALLMILQEAVGNALKHGHAQHVRVKTFFGRRGIAVIVKDDGCGFDTAHPAADRPGLHLGLESMRSRAAKIGGRFDVRSVPGRGTEVKIVLEEMS